MRLHPWLVLVNALLSCIMQHPQASDQRGTIRVSVEDGRDMTGWLVWQHRALSKLWPRLGATGYMFVIDARNPDVRVRTFDAGPLCPHGGGFYEPGRPFVEVDPACAHTAEELRYLVGHEVMHWLTYRDHGWLGHVCVSGDTASDCHPTVHGVGLLSPIMADTLEAETFRASQARLTEADVELLRVLRR